jgi:hypothetical protein
MKELQFTNYKIDFDSTVMTRYGEQEGAKRGRASHYPLMALIADSNMMANMWLRIGDSSSSGNFHGFVEETLERLKEKKVGLVHLDSGFYDKQILSLLEEKMINYLVSVPQYAPIQRKLAEQTNWLKLSEGVEAALSEYQAIGWESLWKIVMIRQTIAERPKATGKQLRLFKNTDLYQRYRFSSLVTNINLPPEELWRMYRRRAEAENKIKELKYDFGFDSFNLRSFYGTETALSFVMLAYNLISLFRHFVLRSEIQRRLSTLRYNTFAIGSYLVREGNQVILKMALTLKRHEWFIGLWENHMPFLSPFIFLMQFGFNNYSKSLFETTQVDQHHLR